MWLYGCKIQPQSKMYLSQCVRGLTTSTVVEPVKEPVKVNAVEVVNTEELTNIIKSAFEEINRENLSVKDDETNLLTKDEVENVLDEVLKLSETVFKDIPLSNTLSAKFVWNIPRDIYDTFVKCQQEEIHPVFNPIVLFYIFLAEDPGYAMGRYLSILSNNLNHPGARYIIDEASGCYGKDVSYDEEEIEEFDVDPDNYDDSYE